MIMLRDGHDKTYNIDHNKTYEQFHDTKKTGHGTFSIAGVIPCHSGTPALISEQCHITSQKKVTVEAGRAGVC